MIAFFVFIALVFYAASILYDAYYDPKRLPENRNEDDELNRKAFLDV